MTNNKISKLKNIIHLYTNTENMTNNKLTVEWLAKSYVDLLTKLNNEEISLKEFEIQYIELLNQAKEMEKEQHGITWDKSMDNLNVRGGNIIRAWDDFNDYYNTTYRDNN